MNHPFGADAAEAAAAPLRDVVGRPAVGIVLGSGLGGIADAIAGAARVPYADIPGFPRAAVAGHAGELIAGDLGGRRVVALSGRFHMYEGHEAALAGFPVRVLHALEVPTLIVSNAAGAVRETLDPGTIVLLRDQMNLGFRDPLIGAAERSDVRFPDMSEPFDAQLRDIARRVAARQGVPLADGVYCGLLGPSYETAAEVRMLRRLGADVVGMSTVPEVIVARALGVRVLGFSCVTNLACGLAAVPITHEEVLATTARVAARLQQLVRGIVSTM